MKKHIGQINNTGQRCLVIFMQIPGCEDHALVVSTDNLPGRFEAALMSVVESREGQAERDLGNVMGRRVLPDTSENLLEALHTRNMLRKVHVDQITMFPLPNMPFPLRGILRDMNKHIPGDAPLKDAVERFNPHANNSAALSDESRTSIARNLLVEADLLEAEVRAKRDKAYTYAPSLRPAFATAETPVLKTIEAVMTTGAKTSKPRTTTRKAPTKTAKPAA